MPVVLSIATSILTVIGNYLSDHLLVCRIALSGLTKLLVSAGLPCLGVDENHPSFTYLKPNEKRNLQTAVCFPITCLSVGSLCLGVDENTRLLHTQNPSKMATCKPGITCPITYLSVGSARFGANEITRQIRTQNSLTPTTL